MPADDAAVLDHLQGRQVMGVYPLLPDETCWFVAADFDGLGWVDDARAFSAVCQEAAVPVAIERSRSGNGAHAWFFFDEAIPAMRARQMVSALLTRTMSGRHELAMQSYDRLFPNQDTSAIKRLAAFQNPEFYKKQGLRLSTALTPRVIACAEDRPSHIALPRGCLAALEALVSSLGSQIDLADRRMDGEKQSFHFEGQLTTAQEHAVEALLAHDTGVFVAPPGTGKTVVGAYMAAARGRNVLGLVHRQPLLDQWRAQLAVFLGLDPKAIGQVGAGKRRPTGIVDVAMVQSLLRRDQVDDLVGESS